MLSGTGEQHATRPDGAKAGPSVPAAAQIGPMGAMPVRRPGGSQGRRRPVQVGTGAAADGQSAPPPADQLQRVLDGLRNLG